jgi:hypothetical protein
MPSPNIHKPPGLTSYLYLINTIDDLLVTTILEYIEDTPGNNIDDKLKKILDMTNTDLILEINRKYPTQNLFLINTSVQALQLTTNEYLFNKNSYNKFGLSKKALLKYLISNSVTKILLPYTTLLNYEHRRDINPTLPLDKDAWLNQKKNNLINNPNALNAEDAQKRVDEADNILQNIEDDAEFKQTMLEYINLVVKERILQQNNPNSSEIFDIREKLHDLDRSIRANSLYNNIFESNLEFKIPKSYRIPHIQQIWKSPRGHSNRRPILGDNSRETRRRRAVAPMPRGASPTRTPRRAASRRAAPRRAAPRRATPRRAVAPMPRGASPTRTPRRAASRRATPRRATPRRAEPRRAAPRRATPRYSIKNTPEIDDIARALYNDERLRKHEEIHGNWKNMRFDTPNALAIINAQGSLNGLQPGVRLNGGKLTRKQKRKRFKKTKRKRK